MKSWGAYNCTCSSAKPVRTSAADVWTPSHVWSEHSFKYRNSNISSLRLNIGMFKICRFKLQKEFEHPQAYHLFFFSFSPHFSPCGIKMRIKREKLGERHDQENINWPRHCEAPNCWSKYATNTFTFWNCIILFSCKSQSTTEKFVL